MGHSNTGRIQKVDDDYTKLEMSRFMIEFEEQLTPYL